MYISIHSNTPAIPIFPPLQNTIMIIIMMIVMTSQYLFLKVKYLITFYLHVGLV